MITRIAQAVEADAAGARPARRSGLRAIVVGAIGAGCVAAGVVSYARQAATSSAASSDLRGYLALVGVAFLVSAAFVALRWATVRAGIEYTLLATAVYVLLVLSPSGRGDLFDHVLGWAAIAAAAIVPALLVHVAVTLTRRTPTARRAGLVAAYSGAAAVVAVRAAALVTGRGAAAGEGLEMALLVGALAVTAVLLFRSAQRSSSGLHRSQMRWILWGLGLGLVPFGVLHAIPWATGAAVARWVEFVAVVPLLVIPAAFTAALVRFRLHDLDDLLRRGFTEVAGILCILAVYAVTKVVLRQGLGGLIRLSESGLRYLALLVAAVAYLQVRAWVKRWVEKAFFQARYSFRSTLLEFGRELNEETDLPRLVDRLELRVRETLDVDVARVLVRSGAHRFEAAGAAAAPLSATLSAELIERLERDRYVVVDEEIAGGVPGARYLFGMKVRDRLQAVLAAGDRVEPEPPLSSEDRALLASLSAHAAAAIHAARLLREVREQAHEVARLQERQERILESSAVGLFLLDAEGRILAWNRALEAIYGAPRQAAIGLRLEEVLPHHLVRRITREIEAADREQDIRIYRQNLVSRAGRRVVVDVSISPAARDDAAEGARVVTVTDVTERVKLEEEVVRQERLASLGLLAAGVAHEVNTPLTGISGYVQMMLEEMEPADPRREILEQVEIQTRRASAIANSLLDLARPDRAAYEEVSLNGLVEEVLRLFEAQVRGRPIRVETRLDPELPPVRAHRGKMQQVLLNLLLNARDALEAGGTIAVSTGVAGERIRIEVQDDGTGIAEEDLPRIFDPFFTTKRRGKGTGLGLSISYGIVEEHRGEMTVESVPGRTTRFRVDLPAA